MPLSKKKLTILHAIDTGGPGGAETVFFNLALGMQQQGHTSITAIKGDHWLAAQLRRQVLEPLLLDAEGAFNFKYLKQLYTCIRKHKIDLVISHLFGSNVYCSLAGKLCGIPVISVFHGGVDVNPNDGLAQLKFRLIRMGSKKIVFVSDHLRNTLQRQFNLPAQQCITIYNGISTAHFQACRNDHLRKKLRLPTDAILIGALGNIRPAKGYADFIDAAEMLRKLDARCKFVIIGQGNNVLAADLQRKVDSLQLQETVFFEGFCQDSAYALNSLDIFVQSSISEGFSIAIVEAMATVLPIVATRSGGPQEILRDGETGLMVDAQAPRQLAEAIYKLIQHPNLAKALALRAREHAVQTFSREAMLVRYTTLLDNL